MRILFVCLGNICRSPTAEAVMRGIAAREAPELDITVDSAGTANYHPGAPPDRRSQAAARQRDYDLSVLRARQVRDEDFAAFDLILAMDRANLLELQARAPREAHSKVQLFLDYAPEQAVREVPDPYYGGSRGFDEVLDLIEAASRGLLRRLRMQAPPTQTSSD
jgi:protein-tyrosine phosphatase